MKPLVALSFILASSIAFAALTGLPKDVTGFATWKKVVTTGLPLDGPHAGKDKLVYANPIAAKAWAGKAALPVGSLVVKTAGSASAPGYVAVMTKTAQGWKYEEYAAKSGTYSLIGSGTLCSSCHVNAKDKDFLFSRQ
jgi:hypothetical protein